MHYKVIACGPMLGSQMWGTEFDSKEAADQAASWLRSKGYDATVIADPEYKNEGEDRDVDE